MQFGLNKKKDIEAAEQLRQLAIAYKRTFNTDKVVLFDLMNKFNILDTHGGDAFKEGQRSVVLHILKQCHLDPNLFNELLQGSAET